MPVQICKFPSKPNRKSNTISFTIEATHTHTQIEALKGGTSILNIFPANHRFTMGSATVR